MSTLNGDSLKVVSLIREAINDSTAQTNKRLDDIIQSNKEVNDNQQKLIDSHCLRVRKLENFRWYLIGIFAVIISLSGLIEIIKTLTK